MIKMKAVSAKNNRAKNEDSSCDESENPSTFGPYSEAPLSRGQRKRRERREAYLRKKDFSAYAKEVLAEESSLNMSTLVNEMKDIGVDGDAPAVPVRSNAKMTRKTKNNIMAKEEKQLNTVLNFDKFQDDPFGALSKHITNTLRKQEKSKAKA